MQFELLDEKLSFAPVCVAAAALLCYVCVACCFFGLICLVWNAAQGANMMKIFLLAPLKDEVFRL